MGGEFASEKDAHLRGVVSLIPTCLLATAIDERKRARVSHYGYAHITCVVVSKSDGLLRFVNWSNKKTLFVFQHYDGDASPR